MRLQYSGLIMSKKGVRGNVRKHRVRMTAGYQRKEPRARSSSRMFADSRSCRLSSRIVNVIKLKKGTINIQLRSRSPWNAAPRLRCLGLASRRRLAGDRGIPGSARSDSSRCRAPAARYTESIEEASLSRHCPLGRHSHSAPQGTSLLRLGDGPCGEHGAKQEPHSTPAHNA